MIFNDLIYVFTGIGIVASVIGAGFLLLFGFFVLEELIGDEYSNYKYRHSKKYNHEDICIGGMLHYHTDDLEEIDPKYKKKE